VGVLGIPTMDWMLEELLDYAGTSWNWAAIYDLLADGCSLVGTFIGWMWTIASAPPGSEYHVSIVDRDEDGYVDDLLGGEDCEDTDEDIHPDATEICGDEIDNDCDGSGNDCGVWGEIDLSEYDTKLVADSCYDCAGYAFGVGDVNGDGIEDLLIGSPFDDDAGNSSGAVHVVHMPVSGYFDLDDSDAKIIGEDEGDNVGYSAASAGDVNGDGLDDILVGSSDAYIVGHRSGVAYFLYSPVLGTVSASSADAKLTGENAWDYAGHGLASAGDVNADGFGDVLISAPGEDNGVVYVFYGPDITGTGTLSMADASLLGAGSNDSAGKSVASAGDVDGDGIDDIIVGATGAGSGGAAYLVYSEPVGASSLAQADATFEGVNSGDSAGYAVASAGDVNDDGYDDVLVGAYFEDTGGERAGAAYLLHGPKYGTMSLADADSTFYGEQAYDYAGSSVSSAGDVNGDGYDDVLVGAPGDYYWCMDGGLIEGAAYVLLGPLSGEIELADADAKLIGEEIDDHAGWSVGSAGDLDGDGFDEVLVGARSYGNYSYGAVYLLYGGLM